MAVTVTDRRSILAYADALSETGDAGAGTWNDGATHTASYAEATGSIATAYNETTGELYFELTAATIDLSDTLIYVQTSVVATLLAWDETDDPPHALFLTDGTNDVAFYYSGNDRRQFSHDRDGPVSWQCFVLDGSLASQKNTDGEAYAIAGTVAGLITNIASIIGAGARFSTQSKALGGGVNCYTDIIRYGNDGIRITAGGVATQGTFSEITVEDRATTNLKAHGIIREYTAGIYGVQGPLTFGDSTTATDCYFEDSNVVIAYEDRDIDDDKYYFNVEGHASATNSFVLSNSTITTAGPYVTCDFSAGNVDTLTLDTVVFSGLGASITFSNSTDASGHTISGCTFDVCGQIDPGDTTFESNTISNTTTSTTGAMLLDDDGTANLQDLSFVSGGTGHAIYIPPGATGPFTLSNYTYSGYGSTATTDAAIYNNSGNSITLNINGGDSPTYLNGTSASTTLVDAKTLKVTTVDSDNNTISGVRVRIENQSTGALITQGTTDASGVYQITDYNYTGDLAVLIKCRLKGYKPFRTSGTINNNGLTVTATLQTDRIVDLP